MEAYKEFIQNEELKINIDELLGNINYGEWLDKPEELQDLTKRILESMLKVLAPLLNIMMSDLPGNPIAWDIWSEEGSSASAIRKGSRKIA
ncbi:hypothetical protein GLOIN_2v1676687 [Rhizophagus irregularis DAOM 181602=DAOM 197198]|nr:hypothetical protein GLOIN_2v1676687 [Rhizophagus irregularis DAOM 181602=DAOM 197198]